MAEFNVGPGAAFEASYGAGTSGLVGTLQVAIIDNDGNVVVGPTSAGIIENTVAAVPTGVYSAELIAPTELGQYSVIWSQDGLWDPVNVSPADQLVVTLAGPATPIIPPDPGGSLVGPCSSWTTADDIAACCNTELGTDISELDTYAIMASQVLYAIVPRFPGLCGPVTARPCKTGCGCWPVQRIAHPDGSSFWLWNNSIWNWSGPLMNGWPNQCGCGCLPEVLLSGYPVVQVGTVLINGEELDPGAYELRDYRKLVRTDGGFWPACQDLAADDTEDGTWSITYTYGEGPPLAASAAAAALACEMFSACNDGECALPSQATRVIRQGITIETLQPLASMLRRGETGIVAIDAFIAAYGGVSRRPAFWSASGPRYAPLQGT